MAEGVSRRGVLTSGAGVLLTGLTGCLGESRGCDSVTLELPDGSTRCVEAVEGDEPVDGYYGYGREETDSSFTRDGLEVNDATVTFVYTNTESGETSLVVTNGNASESSDGGGSAAVTFEGVNGYEWQVQDGRPGTGGGDVDPYETPEGEMGESETVLWGWNDRRTDGGALGPLRNGFDVEVTHRSEATVGDSSKAREGLDRWLFVDGGDPENPIEVAEFEDGAGDVSINLSG